MSALDRLIAKPIARPIPRIAGMRPLLLGAFLVVAMVCLLQVAQTSNATTTGYNLQRLEQQRSKLQAEVHQLEAEVALLTSVERIDKEARDRLGMVPASNTLALEVHKEPPAQQLVPLRFLSAPETAATKSESWWQKALSFLPFF